MKFLIFFICFFQNSDYNRLYFEEAKEKISNNNIDGYYYNGSCYYSPWEFVKYISPSPSYANWAYYSNSYFESINEVYNNGLDIQEIQLDRDFGSFLHLDSNTGDFILSSEEDSIVVVDSKPKFYDFLGILSNPQEAYLVYETYEFIGFSINVYFDKERKKPYVLYREEDNSFSYIGKCSKTIGMAPDLVLPKDSISSGLIDSVKNCVISINKETKTYKLLLTDD